MFKISLGIGIATSINYQIEDFRIQDAKIKEQTQTYNGEDKFTVSKEGMNLKLTYYKDIILFT